MYYNLKHIIHMGNTQSSNKIGFEDIQIIIRNPETYLLINTLPDTEQKCLITNTVNSSQEESLINHHLKTNRLIKIAIYGRNSVDESIFKKHKQLIELGFTNVYIYVGGLFEWLILQDIYGFQEFPTTKKELDFLKYRAKPTLNIQLLEN
jgi:hypothetical protein